MKIGIKLEIIIQEDIDKKYPNYKVNFKNKEQFVNFIINDLISQDTDEFGYTIRKWKQAIKPKKGKRIMPEFEKIANYGHKLKKTSVAMKNK